MNACCSRLMKPWTELRYSRSSWRCDLATRTGTAPQPWVSRFREGVDRREFFIILIHRSGSREGIWVIHLWSLEGFEFGGPGESCRNQPTKHFDSFALLRPHPPSVWLCKRVTYN